MFEAAKLFWLRQEVKMEINQQTSPFKRCTTDSVMPMNELLIADGDKLAIVAMASPLDLDAESAARGYDDVD